ncbi:MAG: DNA methyltransferase, partial [Candidatus Thorarchaeota archaeon]
AKSLTNDGDSVICPQCWGIFDTKSAENEAECLDCGNRFVPRKASYTNGREYYCRNEECQNGRIVDWIRRNGRPKERMYAIEFHCKACENRKNPRLKNGRGYKTPDDLDFEFLEQAKKEFTMKEKLLPIPSTAIPLGVETRRALNHGYSKFRDMFNERQLLNLGKILSWILTISDRDLKEFLVLAFSNSLKYNNTFAKYNATRGFITDIFRTHSYSPSMAPVEANCYDTARGRGAFTAFVNLVVEGKEYCRAPFERVVDGSSVSKIQTGRPIVTKLASDYGEIGDDSRALLQCGPSERIDVPDGVADAVITDPPYYGNVMYSELSNFFYVWLRIALQDSYEHFREELVPWRDEIIENRVQEKGEEEFLGGLTKVFSEASRILKDDGLLVFTFHHKKEEAWAAVLQAILDSGFYVTAIYPVRSEMKASTHLYDMANIIYDMVIVCRKKLKTSKPTTWDSVKRRIAKTTRQTIDHLVENGERPSPLDILVMALGKCLEHYSKEYPDVVQAGRRVGVREALESIRTIVDSEIS